MKIVASFIFLISTLTSLSIYASNSKHISLKNPWIKAVPATIKMSGGYVTLMNNSKKDVELVEAKTKIAEYVELHTHNKVDGVMRMRQVKKVIVPAMGSVQLKPMSYHIMLIQLVRPLKIGEKIPVELVFSDKSSKTVNFTVKKL